MLLLTMASPSKVMLVISESRVFQAKQVGHGCATFKAKYSSGRETRKAGEGGGYKVNQLNQAKGKAKVTSIS